MGQYNLLKMENKMLEIISKSKMFEGIEKEHIPEFLNCIGKKVKTYSRQDYIHYSGEKISTIGLILCGSVSIEFYDLAGNRTILATFSKGEIFAESYALANDTALDVDVVAQEKETTIMFFESSRILNICPKQHSFHKTLLSNLVIEMSKKNILINIKNTFLSFKTIRARIVSYLSRESIKQQSKSFSIPYNRQELADFLSVDRAALSNELSKMQQEGIIRFRKNNFEVLL